MLLTSELVTNAVLHAATDVPRPSAEIVLSIHRTHDLLRVEVRDHDARPVPRVRFLAPLASQTGRGLDVVALLASAWGSIRVPAGEGKVVWFELRIARAAVARDPDAGMDGDSGTTE